MEGDRQKKFDQAMKLIERGQRMLREIEDPNIIQMPKRSKKPIGAIAEFQGSPVKENLLKEVTQEVQKCWIAAYPMIDISIELMKADVWIKTHPARAPKNFGRFFSSWLSRSHENYRKNPGQRGLNQEGFYMTQGMKVSSNNQLMLTKIKETMNVTEERDVGTPAANGRVP